MTTRPKSTEVTGRPFRGDEDYRRVRHLLVETHPVTPTGFNWEVRRWDGWRYYQRDPAWDTRRAEHAHVWETAGGELVAAVHMEGSGDVHLQLHPDHRDVEEELIAWAEEHLATPVGDGPERQLCLDVFEYDSHRCRLLGQRGYEQTADSGFTHRMRLGDQPLKEPRLAEGYTLRTTRPDDGHDCEQVAAILNAAFGRSFHNAEEFRTFAAHAPCFRHDLDLVAVAPDGSFAAYAGVPYEETNRYGVFEPVCTHPDHQRLGLARTLMEEALQRLRALRATDVYVGTGGGIAANSLYQSIGFTEAYRCYRWRKVL